MSRLQDEYLAHLGTQGDSRPDVEEIFDDMSDQQLTELLLGLKCMDKQELLCVKVDQVGMGDQRGEEGKRSRVGKERQSKKLGENRGWGGRCWVEVSPRWGGGRNHADP